jgi:uncharacterized protein (TIGR00106 family)
MSVLLDLVIFPTDRGESVSQYVSKVIDMIRNSGYPYKLGAMGTVIETSTVREALDLIAKAYDILEPYSNRVYAVAKMDIRKNRENRLEGKIKSIEEKIGKVNH